ncbi:hypothetical protein, variant [Aphanomyces invadans]|uniref:Uncharacterized protein n=1 Tax=Aphanomyces invadans TaxID=157072 RepID=A0A024U605_9STRA|nr:hypothetical protein, variant [Aphanomyces invadans]ETW01033.1 hypothetical protein, variant [Aphanomyces invadans]|eukprot:XP_008870031.1 hypothetical protein, variant [Aphanomyces invadans]
MDGRSRPVRGSHDAKNHVVLAQRNPGVRSVLHLSFPLAAPMQRRRRLGVAMGMALLGITGAASNANYSFCRANVLCTMLSGLECNRSGGRCPPCIFQRAAGAMDCREKVSMEQTCPQVELPLLVDCDGEISTTSMPPSTTSQAMPPTTSLVSTTVQPANKDATTNPSADANHTKSFVYWIIAVAGVLCFLLGAICVVRHRKSTRRECVVPPNIQPVHKIPSDPVDTDDVSIPPPLILVSDSQREDLLDRSPRFDSPAFISVSSGPSSADDDDILSTVFMRFRTTVDYANDERNSVFSLLSPMNSPDTVSTDDDEVDI